MESLAKKFRKKRYYDVKKEIVDLTEKLELMKKILEIKRYDRLGTETEVIKKFKKSNPVEVVYLYGHWSEDFVDEDNGEVVTIERRILLGVSHEGVYYKKWKEKYNKDLAITEIIPNFDTKLEMVKYFIDEKRKTT